MLDHVLLQSILNTLEDGVCILDPDGRLRMLNRSVSRLLGFEDDELSGMAVGDAFAPERVVVSVTELLASGGMRQEETCELRRKERTPLAVSYTVDRIRLDDGTDGVLLRFRPLLDSQSCDIALHESEIKLRAILDTIVDAVVAADSKGVIQLFNPAAEKLFGYAREEVIGHNVNLLMPSPDHEAHDSYLANYLRTGVRKIIGIGREVIGKRKDDSRFWLNLSVGEAALGRERMFVAVLHDLSEKKRAEAKLLTLSRAVEQSLNAVMITGVDGVVEYVNPSFTRLTGYAAGEVVGHITPPQAGGSSGEADAAMRAALRGGGEWQGEIQDQKKTGELYWALKTISPIRNAAGEITQYLAIQQDISELKREKEALQESEERFRQVAKMAGEWLWEQGPGGRYIYSSGAVREMLGYEPEEILGKNYLDLLTPEDRDRWSQTIPPDTHRRFTRLSNRYLHRDGHEVFTESTGEPIFDADGTLVKWRGVDHNVTHRKLYEDALRLRDRAIEAASVGIVIADARDVNHPNIYVNPALTRITGYARDELLGANLRILQGPDTDPAAVQEIVDAMREGRGCETVLKNYRKNGVPFWNELSISPVRDEDGVLTHFIGVQTDVTELRRASEEHHELEIAKQIQLSLLPKRPLWVAGAKIAGVCLPATHIGGDYFDYFHTGGTLDVVIADVSGHSVGAALIMAEARSALKAETRFASAGGGNHGPAQILSLLNDVLYEDLSGSDLFVSMFFLRLDLASRRLFYANAGHNCPLLSRASAAACEPLDADGLILGVKKGVVFEEKSLQTEKGDRLLLYTDGITEALNEQGEFFDVPRLCDLFASYRDTHPEIVIGRLIEALHAFRGAAPLEDDVSMAVMSVE
jgi:sigma-B regulation protein RsbU (phosphoserine phosphatase)